MFRSFIFYATETGTSQEYAERIARFYYSHWIEYRLVSLSDCRLSFIVDECCKDDTFNLFLISTTGDGQIPSTMLSLWQELLDSSLPNHLLAKLYGGILGFGDSSYEKFNFAGKKFHRRLLQLGAKILLRGDADEQHPLGHDGIFESWFKEVWNNIRSEYGLPEGRLRYVGPKVECSNGGSKHPEMKSKMDAPYKAKVLGNDRITSHDHFQDVRHLRLGINTDKLVEHFPGDVAILMPVNLVDDVNDLINQLQWNDIADNVISFKIIRDNIASSVPLITTISDLLQNHLDIYAPPKRYFFEILSQFASTEEYAEKLREISSSEGIDLYLDYVWRPRRTPLEILRDFSFGKIPVNFIFDLFGPLRPREFSIASSYNAHPGEIHICSALVKYKTILPKDRVGVCSRWIETLNVGDVFSIRIKEGNWRNINFEDRPIIMIAAGTGIAPMRSLIYYFLSKNDLTLFFGCRYLEKDFHYHKEWEDLKLRYFALGSRDVGGSRQYLSELLGQHRDLILDLIQKDAIFLVAGNNKLPSLVKLSLQQITGIDGFGNTLERTGRLFTECWS